MHHTLAGEKPREEFPAEKTGMDLLVVDDSNSVRVALQEGLAKEGYRVRTAKNGRDALEHIAERSPDLILSDVYMPEMDGLELCAALRADFRYAAIPLVMSTETTMWSGPGWLAVCTI